MNTINIVGMDPSMNNWGIAEGRLDIDTGHLYLDKLNVLKPVVNDNKQIQTKVKDMSRAQQLFKGALGAVINADVICVEVPVGSQSASAMKGYGICVGVLGVLEEMGHSFIIVTPTEVKMVTGRGKSATKNQMIDWATSLYPDAPWPKRSVKGVESIVTGTAEHMADAVAAIHAGVVTPAFNQILPAFRRAVK